MTGLADGPVAKLRAALPPGIDLSYAVKANPMPAVSPSQGLVDRFDVASALELADCFEHHGPAEHDQLRGAGQDT